METEYYSFLLRLWMTNRQNGQPIWRASLQSPDSGEKLVFANLAEMVDYLKSLTTSTIHPGGKAK